MATLLDRRDVLRVVAALVADERDVGRRTRTPPDVVLSWDESTAIDEGGLELDSLEMLACAARVNQFFHLHEVGVEDYLLRDRWLGGWVDLVLRCRAEFDTAFTFQTSGSSGPPKTCIHHAAHLLQEVEHWVQLFAERRRIVSLVPCHHLYGFLFSILLPLKAQLPVVDARAWSPGRLIRELHDGDLIVGFPDVWRYLATSLNRLPPGLSGTTSAAPMPHGLAVALRHAGMDRLTEIYGASEYGAIATRDDPNALFTLLPYWQRAHQGSHLSRLAPDGSTGVPIEPPDALVWSDDRSFGLNGRLDGAIQVGGINVFPSRIAAVIGQHPDVAECSVRAVESDNGAVLEALVVPKPSADQVGSDTLAERVRSFARETLQPAEIPRRITVNGSPQRTALGKLMSW